MCKRRSRQDLISMVILLMLFFTLLSEKSFSFPQQFPDLTGKYLGQKPPGDIPVKFAPGIISTEMVEHSSPNFSPDGNEVYWCTIFKNPEIIRIQYMKMENGKWREPNTAPFSGDYDDANPFFSVDGQKLFFKSYRPYRQGGSPGNALWNVQKTGENWSKPKLVGAPLNTGALGWQASITSDGTIYFVLEGYGGFGLHDIFCSRYTDGKYSSPENLGPGINSEKPDWQPFVAPDENYLIFASNIRDDTYGWGDLYISFRKENGSWTKAKNMGKTINSDKNEGWPYVSPDGKYFFFVSDRDNNTYNHDVYWVDAGIIETLK